MSNPNFQSWLSCSTMILLDLYRKLLKWSCWWITSIAKIKYDKWVSNHFVFVKEIIKYVGDSKKDRPARSHLYNCQPPRHCTDGTTRSFSTSSLKINRLDITTVDFLVNNTIVSNLIFVIKFNMKLIITLMSCLLAAFNFVWLTTFSFKIWYHANRK